MGPGLPPGRRGNWSELTARGGSEIAGPGICQLKDCASVFGM